MLQHCAKCKTHIICYFEIMKEHNTELEQRQKHAASQRVRDSSKGNQASYQRRKKKMSANPKPQLSLVLT